MPKKVLHIIESLSVGGAERLLTGIITDLVDYENHIIILHDPETLRHELPSSCKFVNLHLNGWLPIFKRYKEVRKYIKDNNIDIVHSHLYMANILARLATPRTVPLINSIHAISSLASYKVRRATLYLEKLTYKKRHHIIAVSHEVLKDFDRWVGIKGKGEVLYNFIDDKYFAAGRKKSFSTSSLKLVAVGNLRHQKNYPYMIEAFKKMPADVHIDVYGEGDMREQLQKEIDAHRLNIRLCGVRNDLDKILGTYDAFLMTSFFEGQPVSLLEAVACGLPAILSDVPVLREIGQDHSLYCDLNDPLDLVRRIEEIRAGRVDLATMSAKGYEFVSGFARRSKYIDSLKNIYHMAG